MEDRLNISKDGAHDQIAVAMGGRVAEELVFGQITTGASNDIQVATDLARKMVCEWGMSEKLGPLHFGKNAEMPFLGRDFYEGKDYSEQTAVEIDSEVRRIVTGNYDRARSIVVEHMDKLKVLAEALAGVRDHRRRRDRPAVLGQEPATSAIGGQREAPGRRRGQVGGDQDRAASAVPPAADRSGKGLGRNRQSHRPESGGALTPDLGSSRRPFYFRVCSAFGNGDERLQRNEQGQKQWRSDTVPIASISMRMRKPVPCGNVGPLHACSLAARTKLRSSTGMSPSGSGNLGQAAVNVFASLRAPSLQFRAAARPPAPRTRWRRPSRAGIGLVVASLLVAAGGRASPAPQTATGERIVDFSAVVTVHQDGSLLVSETLTLSPDFAPRPLCRELPTLVMRGGWRHLVDYQVVAASRDGAAVTVTHAPSLGTTTICMPAADAPARVVTLEYRASPDIDSFPEREQLTLRPSGSRWGETVDRATITVQLPAATSGRIITAEARAGRRVPDSQYVEWTSAGTTATVTAQGASLSVTGQGPDDAFEIIVGLAKGTVAEATVGQRWKARLAANLPVAISLAGVLVVALVFAVPWLLLRARTRPASTAAPETAPPADLSPAAARVLKSRVPDERAFAAELLNLSAKGLVRVDEHEGDVALELVAPMDGSAAEARAPEESAAAAELFRAGPWLSFGNAVLPEMRAARGALYRQLLPLARRWFVPYRGPRKLAVVVALGAWLATLATLLPGKVGTSLFVGIGASTTGGFFVLIIFASAKKGFEERRLRRADPERAANHKGDRHAPSPSLTFTVALVMGALALMFLSVVPGVFKLVPLAILALPATVFAGTQLLLRTRTAEGAALLARLDAYEKHLRQQWQLGKTEARDGPYLVALGIEAQASLCEKITDASFRLPKRGYRRLRMLPM